MKPIYKDIYIYDKKFSIFEFYQHCVSPKYSWIDIDNYVNEELLYNIMNNLIVEDGGLFGIYEEIYKLTKIIEIEKELNKMKKELKFEGRY